VLAKATHLLYQVEAGTSGDGFMGTWAILWSRQMVPLMSPARNIISQASSNSQCLSTSLLTLWVLHPGLKEQSKLAKNGSLLFASQEVTLAWSKCGLGGGYLLAVSWECPSTSVLMLLESPCAGILVQLVVAAVIRLSTNDSSWVTLGASSRTEVRPCWAARLSTGSRGMLSCLAEASLLNIVSQFRMGSMRLLESFKFDSTTVL
jgi:hypothetical protein